MTTNKKPNLYELLEINEKATEEEIKKKEIYG